MASSHQLIERFRKQRPSSRAERNRQRENGEVRQTWWNNGGGESDSPPRRRPQQQRDGPYTNSVLRPAANLKTRTAPAAVRFSDSLDLEQLPSPPMRRSGNGVDDLILEDIVDFESHRRRPAGADDLDGGGGGFAASPPYNIERRTTQTRTRFRFTPPRGAAPNEAFELGHSGPQCAARRSVCISRTMMQGQAQLTADGPSGSAPSEGEAAGFSAEAATIEITTTLDTTLALLHDKLGGGGDDDCCGGGGMGPGALPLPDFDYVCSEDFPSTINAVTEKLEAGLTTFKLLYDAKFKQEDDAAQEEADAKKAARQEIVDQVRQEHLNHEIFGVVDRAVGAVGCIEDGARGPAGRDARSAIPLDQQQQPTVHSHEQMAKLVMDSVAERVEMIRRLESGEIDLSEVPLEDVPPLLPGGSEAGGVEGGGGGGGVGAAVPGGVVDCAPRLEQQHSGRQQIQYQQQFQYQHQHQHQVYCEQQQYRQTGNLEATSAAVKADLDVTMTYMQARLGFQTEDKEKGPGDGVEKGKSFETSQERKDREEEEQKELEKEINIAKLQKKMDEEDAVERNREYVDRLDLALLGDDDDDDDDVDLGGGGGGGGRPEFVNWDLYKTQSIDMAELLASRRAAGLQANACRPPANHHQPNPALSRPSWFDPPPMPGGYREGGALAHAPQPVFHFDDPSPSAPPPPPTGGQLTGEPRATKRITGGPTYEPVIRPFSGAVETDEPAGGGIFGGANTYQDSSEVASIEDSKERLASFRKIREAAERAGSAEQRYSARLTAPAEMKDPSDIEDARARLDEFRAMRAAATRILHAGV
jgi:hypothetical protein